MSDYFKNKTEVFRKYDYVKNIEIIKNNLN